MGVHSEEPLYTPQCGQRLEKLSQRLVGFGENGGWAKCFSGEAVESGTPTKSSVSEQGTQRKRKGSLVILDSDGEETGQQSKRIKMDVSGSECLNEAQRSTDEVMSARLGRDASEGNADGELQPAADSPCEVLPEHIKVGNTSSALSTGTFITILPIWFSLFKMSTMGWQFSHELINCINLSCHFSKRIILKIKMFLCWARCLFFK